MAPRCFLGCPSDLQGHLHVFPNPERFPERFNKWIEFVGGELNISDVNEFFRKKRLCDRHFTVKDKNRNNRLNALAVPSLLDVTTTVLTIENSTTVKTEPASYNNVVEEDPLKLTEDPISYTSFIEDVPSPQAPEVISCTSPIMDVPSPQAEEITISCTSPIVECSPPKPTTPEKTLHTGSNPFAVLKHTYSKFKVPEKCNVAAPDVFNDKAFVPISDYKCQQRQIRLLKQQIYSLQKRCISYRKRLAEASKPSVAFQKVTKNMTEPAKLLTKMQFTQTHKKPAGRRFSLEEKDFSLSLYKTSPQAYSFLAHCFTLPSIKLIKGMLAQENLEPYLTLDKNSTLASNKTLVQEKLQPYLTLDKNSTVPSKITLKDMLAHETFEPYLTLEKNSSVPLKITLKDILAHKQLEPYLTLKKNATSPPKKPRVREKPQPHRTLKKKSILPSKKAIKGILAQEKLEPYLTFNKNSKTYLGKRKVRTETE